MEWSMEAEERIRKAPFFIRNMARKKAEDYARKNGKTIVEVQDVEAAKSDREIDDLSTMDLSIKGLKYSKYLDITPCGGLKGCPLTLFNDEEVTRLFYRVLKEERVGESIEKKIGGPILLHKKFKGAISGCPNSCSQPQIKDISILGYKKIMVEEGNCSKCHQCIKACPEGLIYVDEEPIINLEECLDCGRCMDACPTDSIKESESGYRISVGGKLGRHPKLARIYKDVRSLDELEEELRKIAFIFKTCVEDGERFSDII